MYYASFIVAPRAAFTLIELSVVLVVISLLTGGVLVGLDLMEISKAKAQLSQLERYQVAMTTFKLKYNCVAGDCASATTFGLGPSGGGNKLIDSNSHNSCVSSPEPLCHKLIGGSNNAWLSRGLLRGEAQYMWVHLSAAEMISEKIEPISLANGTADTDPNNMGRYFPKAATGKTYLTAFTWNNKSFISSYVTRMDNNSGAQGHGVALSQVQMQHMDRALGYNDISYGVNSNDYNAWLWTGRKINPTAYLGLRPARHGNACVEYVSGVFQYNLDGEFGCNFMYRIDY